MLIQSSLNGSEWGLVFLLVFKTKNTLFSNLAQLVINSRYPNTAAKMRQVLMRIDIHVD